MWLYLILIFGISNANPIHNHRILKIYVLLKFIRLVLYLNEAEVVDSLNKSYNFYEKCIQNLTFCIYYSREADKKLAFECFDAKTLYPQSHYSMKKFNSFGVMIDEFYKPEFESKMKKLYEALQQKSQNKKDNPTQLDKIIARQNDKLSRLDLEIVIKKHFYMSLYLKSLI